MGPSILVELSPANGLTDRTTCYVSASISRGGFGDDPPLKMLFVGADEGVTRPYKCIFRGGSVTTVTLHHL